MTARHAAFSVIVVVILFALTSYYAAREIAAYWYDIKSPITAEIAKEQQQAADAVWQQQKTVNIDVLHEEIALLRANAWQLNRQGEVLANQLGLPGKEIFADDMCFATDNKETTVSIKNTGENINAIATSINKLKKQYILLEDKTVAATVLKNTIPIERPIVGHNWRTSLFGYRKDPFTGKRRFHSGYDYSARVGTPVIAAATGIVAYSGRLGSYGNAVRLIHGRGVSTLYGHLNDINVSTWQYVRSGDTIGTVGSTGRSTGPHLHYEVRINNRPKAVRKAIKDLHKYRNINI